QYLKKVSLINGDKMIYFDNAATTKPSATALTQAEKFNNEMFYNPSALYMGGLNNSKEIKKAKETILKKIGALESDYDLTFTSCGSESDNMAVFCAVNRGTFITDKGEHSAIYKSFLQLKNKGVNVVFVDLNKDGSVNIDSLLNAVKENNTTFVSIVHVNNETGAINDINNIASKVKKINPSIIFHSDGVQAFGKIPYVISKDIDLYSISAHKINALKGTGALVRRKKVNVNPLIFGGGQENGLRSGTENVFGIKVFEYATCEHYLDLKGDYDRIKKIKNYILDNLDKNYIKVISGENSSPYILTVSAVGIRGEVLMHTLENYNIIVGNGSACSSKNRFSRVIEACGYDEKVLDGIVRISFSKDSTINEAEEFVKVFNKEVARLKGIM
ncbi:MAG: cysteine desulfurase, partial [Clostridia bacterium]|nr:cysteine desulfurase [Clostridia bacterium]